MSAYGLNILTHSGGIAVHRFVLQRKFIAEGTKLLSLNMLWLLTKFRLFLLIFYLFQSSNYTCSVNYFCKTLFTRKSNNEVTVSPKLSVAFIFCQRNLTVLLKPIFAYTNNIDSLHCSKLRAFGKTSVSIPAIINYSNKSCKSWH